MMRELYFILFFASHINLSFSQNYFALVTVKENENGLPVKRHCYIDESGKVLYKEKDIPKEQIYPPTCGLGLIKRNNKYGFVNAKGEVVIPIEYDEAKEFHEELSAVEIDKKWGFINVKGEIVIKPTFDHVLKFSNGLAGFRQDKKFGYINTKGEVIIQPIYDRISHFHNNKTWVLLHGKWSCIGLKGELIIQPFYSDTQDFSEGYAWVHKDAIWGLIDSTNRFIVSPNEKNVLIYAHSSISERFSQFKNGLMISKSYGKVGYCNTSLKRVIENKFDDAEDFEDGIALVQVGKKWGIIDTTGKYVIEPNYKSIKKMNFDFYAIENDNGKFQVITKDGKLMNNHEYYGIYRFDKIRD